MEINEKKVTAKNQEKNYQSEIKIQEKKKNQLNKDIKILKIKIEHYLHEKKLNELRLKEINKIQEDMQKKKVQTQREQK